MVSADVSLNLLALYLRWMPWESGRWRLIPYVLKQCQRNCTTPTIRTVGTRHGFRMRLDLGDWLGRHIFVTGEYEPGTTTVVKACLRRGGVFVDVGANVGYFSLLALKCVGPEGRVLSFEPLPEVRASLKANLELNDLTNCDISSVALFNKEGDTEFFAGPVSHYGVSSLRPIDDFSKRIQVRTARLDAVLAGNQRVDLVKIDVEGAECRVLEGMKETLQRCSPEIIIEVSPSFLTEMGNSVGQIDQLLVAHGYRSYAIEHNGLRPLRSLTTYRSEQFNAFLTTQSSIPEAIQILDTTKQ